MKTKPNKLTIVKVSALPNLPATQPKPRKEDIINAMVERARVKHTAESASMQDAKNAKKKKVYDAIKALLASHPEQFEITVNFWNTQGAVEHRCASFPPKIVALIRDANNAPTMRLFDASAVKAQIRAGMDTAGDRVKALLSDTGAVKALDAALEAITTKAA